MADQNQDLNALFDFDDNDDDEVIIGPLDPGPNIGIRGVLNNLDTAPQDPFFLSSMDPTTDHENPAGIPSDWFQTQPQLMFTQDQPMAGLPVPEESLPYMMHDIDNRTPGNNPFNQAGVPFFLQDTQPNYPADVIYDWRQAGPGRIYGRICVAEDITGRETVFECFS